MRKRYVLKWIDDVLLVDRWYPDLLPPFAEGYGDSRPGYVFIRTIVGVAQHLRSHKYQLRP